MGNTVKDMLVYLLGGVPITLEVSILALLLTILTSLILAVGRMSAWAVLRWPAGFVIELFRGTSVLMQLFWVFYVLPFFGIVVSPTTAGVIVLGLCEGAYFSEVVRAALTSVMKGQSDAITSLHLSRSYAFFRITLRQALPLMIPPFGNAAMAVIKMSALVSLITLQDVTFRVHALHASTGDSASAYTAALLIYLCLSMVTLGAVFLLERFVSNRSGRSPTKLKFFEISSPSIPSWAFGK
jgi:polar amino acid transport system permease protein